MRKASILLAGTGGGTGEEFRVVLEFVEGSLNHARRSGGGEVLAFWRDIGDASPSFALEARASLYGLRYLVRSDLVREDFVAFAEQLDVLAATRTTETFAALGTMIRLGPDVRRAVTRAWTATAADARGRAFEVLAEHVFGHVHARQVEATAELAEWLLDQLVVVGCLDDVFRETGNYYVRELLTQCGRPPVAWLAGLVEARAARQATEGDDYEIIPRVSLDQLVATGTQDGDAIRRIFEVCRVASRDAEWVARIDPGGATLLPLIEASVVEATDHWALARAAQWATHYPENLEHWRRIALCVVSAAAPYPTEEREHAWRYLMPTFESYSGLVGEVPLHFLEKLERAKAHRDKETVNTLRPYWEWRVRCATDDLVREREFVEEED